MKQAHKLRARFISERLEAMRMARMCRDTVGTPRSVVRDLVRTARSCQHNALKISKVVL